MKGIEILLVEDNEGDILLTKEAFEINNIVKKINVAKDGIQAIDFLLNSLVDSVLELPDLVLLDINLPKKNGHEVLQFIKTDNRLKHIPVLMLTTSSSESDILSCYKNHANCYITKPAEMDDFHDVITKVEHFWFNLVKIPHRSK